MTWSTRQLADLAGSTVKAIRHYHDIGLLDVPERASNGYKQYEVSHLVRLLQIKRLTDMGLPLSQVPPLESDDSAELIRELDADLAATAERISRVRAELAVLLEHRAPMHVPPEFAAVSWDLPEAHRSMLMVYSRLFNEDARAFSRRPIEVPDGVEDEFSDLPADADEDAVLRIAEKLVPTVRRNQDERPAESDPAAGSPRRNRTAQHAMGKVLLETYNPAQLRVLRHIDARLNRGAERAEDLPADRG
ncbi:MerR family transcriptional regulator [Saccharopolyspora sp. MS10]|uniref:MerR family transcriptional regulator n=1 Tax=Saccharopolyspora sp. MS10 TaxID=3385973 RepID=UPI0039A1F654